MSWWEKTGIIKKHKIEQTIKVIRTFQTEILEVKKEWIIKDKLAGQIR